MSMKGVIVGLKNKRLTRIPGSSLYLSLARYCPYSKLRGVGETKDPAVS